MIQEPQQPEIIEIPVVNSMSTTVNSSCQNKLLNTKNPNSNNNKKSQRTLLQIPKLQNSKPRIFLLTRPAKSRLVRLETQTVRPHPQRNLNLSLLHHPQKTATATPVTVSSQKHSKIIRIPFLPRSQVQKFSLKSNTSQVLKKDLKIVPNQVHQYSNREVIRDPIIQVNTKSQLSPPTSAEISSNHLQTQQTSVKNILAKSTVNYLNLSENRKQIIQTQVKAQAQSETQKPLTLASMAGIELTGADMSLLQADMSGAMPPTATVEEINVPVFIDEYLQEATAASTTSVNNNFNINNYSNNTSQYINNNHSNEKGNEVNNFLDTFEFDINLLTEHSSDDKETALEVPQQQQQQSSYHSQQQLTEVDDNKNSKQHQLELQMMLEEILFNNNNNTSNNDNNNCTTSNHNNNNNNNNNNNITTMASNDEIEEFFKCAPGNFMDESSPFDDIDGTDLMENEDAINLNNINNNFTLSECFNNSQQNDIMFTSGCSQSQSSQKLIANEIANAEPYINVSVEPTTSVVIDHDMESWNIYPSESNDENILTDCSQTKSLLNNLKRISSQTMVRDIPEKRLKLDLNTKQCKVQQQPEINTPNIIDILGELNDDTMPSLPLSYENIIGDLISSSPGCVSVKSENIDDTTNDYSPPNTPFSYNSFSNQSNFVNTSPNSPASSIATITNASMNTKRGRGRPAKTHSDIPDRSQIQHLSESEQKKLLERAKNNEASRKSRLKHKERDNALEREEICLTLRNRELVIELEQYKKMEKKLKAALKRQLFN